MRMEQWTKTKKKIDSKIFEFRGSWIVEEWGEVGCDTRNEFEEIENWARDEHFRKLENR